MYRAAAALPYADRERATAGLRGQLRIMALADEVTPDWSTLVIQGPTEAPGARGRVWLEWVGTVHAPDPGGTDERLALPGERR